MKKLTLILCLELILISFLSACSNTFDDVIGTGNSNSGSIWAHVVAFLLALYEIIIRLVPTVQNYSLVHWIITFLKWISEKLNNQKSIN